MMYERSSGIDFHNNCVLFLAEIMRNGYTSFSPLLLWSERNSVSDSAEYGLEQMSKKPSFELCCRHLPSAATPLELTLQEETLISLIVVLNCKAPASIWMEVPRLFWSKPMNLRCFPVVTINTRCHTIYGVMPLPLSLMHAWDAWWRKAAGCLDNCL